MPQSTPNKDNDRYKELMNESLDELTALFKKGTQTLQATKAAIETPNISIEAAPIKAALALYELLEHGYQYSIHIVISLFDKAWNEGFANRFKRVIAFNDMSKADMPTSLIKQYKLDNMLKSIRNNDEEETRALLVIQDSVTKLRPVIYEMTKYEIDMENLK